METYRSPVETLCTNIDYYIPDDKGATKSFSEDAMARLRKKIYYLLFFVVVLFFSYQIKSKEGTHTVSLTGLWKKNCNNYSRLAEKDDNGVFLKQ